jgi:hypothetical protein
MSFRVWVAEGIVRIALELGSGNGPFHVFNLMISRKGVKFHKILNCPF